LIAWVLVEGLRRLAVSVPALVVVCCYFLVTPAVFVVVVAVVAVVVVGEYSSQLGTGSEVRHDRALLGHVHDHLCHDLSLCMVSWGLPSDKTFGLALGETLEVDIGLVGQSSVLRRALGLPFEQGRGKVKLVHHPS
jgi:hypothetical protein